MIRLIELFGGIGSQSSALENLNIPFEHYLMCDFDKYAVCSYNAIHGTNFQPMDITKMKGEDLGIIDTENNEYIVTYSFPCQDLSLAGKQRGMKKGENTRSSMLWEVERLLNECNDLPQWLIMENVPQVHGKKNIKDFNNWCQFLENIGYVNYYTDLNSKNYGVAQNRNRCFMISTFYRENYNFPKSFELNLRLKDYLEEDVDEKYYLSQKQIENITLSNFSQKISQIQTKSYCDTILSRDYKDPKCVVVADLHIPGRLESACRVHSVDGVAPACNTCGGGGLETKILEPTILRQGHGFVESRELKICPTVTGEAWNYNNFLKEPTIIEDFYANREAREYTDTCPTLRSDRIGLKVKEPIAYDEQNKRLRIDGTVGTLTTDGSSPKHNNRVILYDDYNNRIRQDQNTIGSITPNIGVTTPKNSYKLIEQNITGYRIRKLTPKECWRLMSFTDEEFESTKAALDRTFYKGKDRSNSQLYKQAGNSIVVKVLEHIFKTIFDVLIFGGNKHEE